MKENRKIKTTVKKKKQYCIKCLHFWSHMIQSYLDHRDQRSDPILLQNIRSSQRLHRSKVMIYVSTVLLFLQYLVHEAISVTQTDALKYGEHNVMGNNQKKKNNKLLIVSIYSGIRILRRTEAFFIVLLFRSHSNNKS